MAASEESPTFFIDELLKGSKIEVGNLFNKLSSWSKEREESQKQLSNIICSYNTIVTQGINDMAEGLRGFSDMQAQLLAVTDERDSLLATVNNLNDEVKELSDKLAICYKTLNLDHDDDGEARSSKRADRTHYTEPQPGETLKIDVNSEAGSEKRGMWTRLTNNQTKVLQDFLQANAFPKNGDLEYLSEQLNVSCKRIKNWFANARQKTGIKGKRGRPKVENLDEVQEQNNDEEMNHVAGFDKRAKHEMQGSGEDYDDSSDREFIGTEDDIKVETPEIITADTETAAAANTQVDPA